MRKYANDKTSLEYRLLKNRYKLLLKNKKDLDNLTLKKDKILNYTLNQAEVVHQLTLIDDEINKAYKLKELYIDLLII